MQLELPWQTERSAYVWHWFKPILTEKGYQREAQTFWSYLLVIPISNSLLHFLTCHCNQPLFAGVIHHAVSKMGIHFRTPSFISPPWTGILQMILWVSTLLTKVASNSSLLLGLAPPSATRLGQIKKAIFPTVLLQGAPSPSSVTVRSFSPAGSMNESHLLLVD